VKVNFLKIKSFFLKIIFAIARKMFLEQLKRQSQPVFSQKLQILKNVSIIYQNERMAQ
jgi:hypothetical protein